MSKPLLDRFLARAVRQGRLGIVFADGSASTFGTPAPGFPEIVLRFTDARVPRDILLDPRLGAAEAFIDGRLRIEEGDVLGLVSLLRANNAWDKGGDLRRPGILKRLANRAGFAAEQINNRVGSKKNVAHHYDIGNDLYALMLDAGKARFGLVQSDVAAAMAIDRAGAGQPRGGAPGPVVSTIPQELTRIAAAAEAAGITWEENLLRHSFGTYRLAVTKNAATVAEEMGNSAGVVRTHYTNVAGPAEATAYWRVAPSRQSKSVLAPFVAKPKAG